MAELLVPSPLPRLALAAFSVAALALSTGCVTRTVYVVDDRDEPVAVAPQAQAAPLPSDPPRGVDVLGPDEFYEPLAPYGTWHAHPRFGYVFAPAGNLVGAGWRPYTRGHWEYTEWGWTWVSDLPFGWATFHYGRWFYDGAYGWVWVPGTQWAPAWVTWRTGGGYVGWAPMPPGAVYGASYSVYDTAWIFVSTANFGAPLIYPVIVTGSYYRNCLVVTRPYRTTYVVYGNTYYRGPDPDRVRREGGRVVHRPIREVDDDRPTTRPPRGVRVSSRGHGGHDGSTGSRRGGRDGRDGDRARPNDRDRGDDRVRRPDDGRGGGRGDGRGRGDDRVGQRDDAPGRGGRGDAPGRRRDNDDRITAPGRPDGRPVGSDGRGGGARGDGPGQGDGLGRGDGRGQDRDDRGSGRDPAGPRVPPGLDGDRPGRDGPGRGRGDEGNGGIGVVTPRPNPGGPRGGDDHGQGGDEGGVPANKDVVRPDGDERRPPSDNPYGRHPGGSGGGFGAQAAPAPDASRAGPSDSRFGRRLPSRFGAPSTQTPAPSQAPRSPALAPRTSTPAPSQAPRNPALAPPSRGPTLPPATRAPTSGSSRPTGPTTGYGRPPATQAPSPTRQAPSHVRPSPSTSTPRYTAPAPARRQAPAASSSRDDERKQQKKRTQRKNDDGERKRQPRRR